MGTSKTIKVTIEPGCITCGVCEFIEPEVFEVDDRCRVRQGGERGCFLVKIREAALACPVQVISYTVRDTEPER